MKLSVLISTYGDQTWAELAHERAYTSAERENPDEIVVHHDPEGTIASCRNSAARQATGDWFCFLDADDELGHGYVRAMNHHLAGPWSTLLTPAVSYVLNGRPKRPKFWPEIPLEQANWLVIGTLVHRTMFQEVGGFKDYGRPPGSNAFEDWAFWARCVKAGARIVKVPRAVYVAHVDRASRHRGASGQLQKAWHQEIGRDVWPHLYTGDGPLPLAAANRRRRGR